MMIRLALPIAAALTLALLAGCGAVRPGQPQGFGAKRGATSVGVRGADVVPVPVTSPELRLPLSEDGFLRLRAAFSWKPQADRTDFYFDAWDGAAFRRASDPLASRLRLKLKGDKVAWQISRVVERREIARSGLPVQLTVARAWEDRMDPQAIAHLLKRTDEFFLWLDEGGEPLRQRAREVDVAWRYLPWPGADLFFPAAQTPGSDHPALFPAAMKRRHGMTVQVPRDEVGGGLTLSLHFDEARDAEGHWVDSFEIEAEPIETLPPDAYEGSAVDFGRALAAVGLTANDLAPERGDATLFTTRQLARP